MSNIYVLFLLFRGVSRTTSRRRYKNSYIHKINPVHLYLDTPLFFGLDSSHSFLFLRTYFQYQVFLRVFMLFFLSKISFSIRFTSLCVYESLVKKIIAQFIVFLIILLLAFILQFSIFPYLLSFFTNYSFFLRLPHPSVSLLHISFFPTFPFLFLSHLLLIIFFLHSSPYRFLFLYISLINPHLYIFDFFFSFLIYLFHLHTFLNFPIFSLSFLGPSSHFITSTFLTSPFPPIQSLLFTPAPAVHPPPISA